jgi:hypothetical protein
MTGRLSLRPYQEVDVRRAHEEYHNRVQLRHVQGLGKTVLSTRICEDEDQSPHGPVVVICRTHLIVQWIRHYRNEYPGATILSVVEEKPNGRWRELDRQEKVEMLHTPADVYVLPFSIPRRVKKTASVERASGSRTVREVWRDMAEEHGWVKSRKQRKVPPFEYPLPKCRSLIVDESHHLRGRDSQQYAGIYQLAVPTKQRKAADRVVLTSATPAWREQDDLYTQLRLLDPKTFRSYWDFVDRYCIVDDTDYGSKVVGGRPKAIAKLLSRYAINRDYSDPDVQVAVPYLIEEEVLTVLSPGGAQAYDRLERKLAADRSAGYSTGSGVSDFARITAHDKNKIADLDAVLEEIDGRFALFCRYQETAELLAQHTGLPLFTGRSGGSRFERADRIKDSGSFVGTIGCINEGVNLSHLKNMVFYEADYTWGAMDQVRTRLKRWRADNSTDPIRCVYVLACATIDEIAYERSMQRGATEAEVLEEIKKRARTKAS